MMGMEVNAALWQLLPLRSMLPVFRSAGGKFDGRQGAKNQKPGTGAVWQSLRW